MIFPIDEIAKLNLSILSSFVSKRFSFASFHFYLQFWSELKKPALWFLNGVVHKLLIESVYNSRAENFYEIRRWLFLFPFKKKIFSLHFVCSSEWNWVIRKERNILENHNQLASWRKTRMWKFSLGKNFCSFYASNFFILHGDERLSKTPMTKWTRNVMSNIENRQELFSEFAYSCHWKKKKKNNKIK